MIRVTPAMEAGLSDHVWSIGEIVILITAFSRISAINNTSEIMTANYADRVLRSEITFSFHCWQLFPRRTATPHWNFSGIQIPEAAIGSGDELKGKAGPALSLLSGSCLFRSPHFFIRRAAAFLCSKEKCRFFLAGFSGAGAKAASPVDVTHAGGVVSFLGRPRLLAGGTPVSIERACCRREISA
jgi:hypothetical protein